MISEWIAAILLVLGAFFMFVAGLGVLRLSDVFLRMHAATKAPSLGVFLMVIALMFYFQNFWLSIQSLLIMIFIFMTAPISAHTLSRAAHVMHISKSKRTQIDQLESSTEGKHADKSQLSEKNKEEE
jgi:multicomponent Na+:H+ antiporter subunit G